ncbi:MAG: hypothetical protein AB1938_30600 [Myxococcota bacterium]
MKLGERHPPARAPWDALTTSGEVRVLEAEVAALREALRRPAPPEHPRRRLEEERRALLGRVHQLEDERVLLAARRDALRTAFDDAARAGRRRDGRLRAAGHLLGLGLLVAATLFLLEDAPGWLRGGGGPEGLALLTLATVGLGLRVQRRSCP